MLKKTVSLIRRRSTHILAMIVASLAIVAAVRVGAGDKPAARKALAQCVQHADQVAADKSPWGTLRWLMNDKLEAGSPLTVGLVEINAGQSNPMHFHGNSDEVIYVLSGSCQQRVGDETVVLKAGDALRVRAGVPHQAKALGNEPLRSLVVYNSGDRQFTPVEEKAK